MKKITRTSDWLCKRECYNIALILAFFFFTTNVQADNTIPNVKLPFRQITSINGLSNITVFDIAQDSEGYMWFATREGLNKFDGNVIQSYYSNDSSNLPANYIFELLISSSQEMIVGTQNGACIYEKESDSFLSIQETGRSLGSIWQIIELHNGDILLSSTTGLFRLNEDMELLRISDLEFRDICEYRNGIIWGLFLDDIIVINLEGEVIRRFSNVSGQFGDVDFLSANIECLFKDSMGKIWLGTKKNGIAYYDDVQEKFFHINNIPNIGQLDESFVRVINEDTFGRLWIGTESGLYIYDTLKNDFSFYGQSYDEAEQGLKDKAIYSIFRSRDNLMWVGTYFGGVNYTSLDPRGFNRIYADGGIKRIGGNAVSQILETEDGDIWLGTEDAGISIFDPENQTFSYIKHRPGDSRSLSSNNVHALTEDKNGNIWIGTFLGGLNKYYKKTGQIEWIDLIPQMDDGDEDVYHKSIFSIHIDSKNRCWVGSIGGLFMREDENSPFTLWKPELFRENFIYHIEEDYFGNIWVASYNEGVYMIAPDLSSVKNYRSNNNHNIKSDRIIFILPDKDEAIWFGTVDGGLTKYEYTSELFITYDSEDGLPNNTVYAIAKDNKGYLWLSTNRGLSRFNPEALTFTNFTESDGLVGNQFNFKSGIHTTTGLMFFGAVNGMTFFDPLEVKTNERKPEIQLTDFKIFNNSVPIGKESILKKHINFQDELVLRYRNKVFTIDYVALNYMSPKNVNYAYYLEGLEKDWNYIGNRQSATYTNLLPGKYAFHLKATNDDSNWDGNERILYIRILPPFWISPWGFILYAIILVSSILLIIRMYTIRQQEKMNVRLATMEKKKNEEISKHRLNFFTYISHEFKTPLTLIIATLEHIMNYENVLPKFKDYSLLMRKNAMRLLFLINQLMDFRRIETDHASIRYNKGDIISFLESTFMTFKPLMRNMSIKYTFSSDRESYIAYFDPDKIEKILTNLISNSCKSFEQPGMISMEVKISERVQFANPASDNDVASDLVIILNDTGTGISPEKLEHIYKPFVSSDPSDFNSSGIGLSLVNSLVKYLNGTIDFSSRKHQGTRVLIQLPLMHNPSPDLIKNDTFINNNTSFDLENTTLFLDSQEEEVFQISDEGTSKEYSMLIAEDNKELSSFLSHHFGSIFKISIAYDGKDAYEKARNKHPDIIISDIMMPLMDGYSLCTNIKENIETSHIPVILLTSKNTAESRIEGFFKGADAYVGKPFNLKELDLQVRNILRFRERLRKHFASFNSMPDSVGSLGNKDQMLIKQLTDTVYKHLDNGAFDVEMFCKEVNLSRTLLHMKLKNLTGFSTTEFIKSIRLNEANKMLKENKFTIAEIAYKVGYNDPAYFSKAYKKQFGKSPSKVTEDI